jgi:8-oxo-dGTP pyrophosphatase MutT (NUDIX family)
MDFQDFMQSIPRIEKEVLLGEAAHAIMSPPERAALVKNLDLATKNPRKAAVMMLLYPKNSQTQLVLIQRNTYPGVHSSQIAFPGGKVEPSDASFSDTALRETHEEVGIPAKQITLVRAFSEVYIPPSNFLVYPYLGYSSETLSFTPDPDEVAGIIEFPLLHLLDDANVVNQRMATSYSESIAVPSFKIHEHYVWGATAMMLSELKETLKKVV